MAKRGKKYLEKNKKISPAKKYELREGIQLITDNSFAQFDETVEIAVCLGVDPRHADQMVRGSVLLPHGLGKEVRLVTSASDECLFWSAGACSSFSMSMEDFHHIAQASLRTPKNIVKEVSLWLF